MYRLRVIAGPNGSGKTTLTKDLKDVYNLNFGIYVNADDIALLLEKHNKLSFRRFDISVDDTALRSFIENHTLRHSGIPDFHIRYNTLYLDGKAGELSYFPTLLADFVRYQLLPMKRTFSFETVMSGSDKLLFLEKAKAAGYRIYLYFICIETDANGRPTANVSRVRDRVEKLGHHVPEEKIIQRYEKTLKNLLPALKLSNRAYLFDNSGGGYQHVASIQEGTDLEFSVEFVPFWFEEYVLK